MSWGGCLTLANLFLSLTQHRSRRLGLRVCVLKRVWWGLVFCEVPVGECSVTFPSRGTPDILALDVTDTQCHAFRLNNSGEVVFVGSMSENNIGPGLTRDDLAPIVDFRFLFAIDRSEARFVDLVVFQNFSGGFLDVLVVRIVGARIYALCELLIQVRADPVSVPSKLVGWARLACKVSTDCVILCHNFAQIL